jgi:hypothetical protein
LHEARAAQHSVIIRPRSTPAVAFIQLDDLDARKVERVKPYSLLVICTSPGNFQAWIAIRSAPYDDNAWAPDFSQRLRRGVGGADHRANGAGRLAGSRNFKPRHGPAFPRVELVHIQSGHVVNCADLESAGLVAQKSAPPRPPKPSRQVNVGGGYPDYQSVLRRAPMRADGSGPDRSKADAFWCKWAAERGHCLSDIAAKLEIISEKAREELSRGNADYALHKAEWGCRAAGNPLW